MTALCDPLMTSYVSVARSNRSQMFFKKGVPISFAILAGKSICWSLFLIVNLLKRDSNTVVSCEYYQIFKNIFLQNTSGGGF